MDLRHAGKSDGLHSVTAQGTAVFLCVSSFTTERNSNLYILMREKNCLRVQNNL